MFFNLFCKDFTDVKSSCFQASRQIRTYASAVSTGVKCEGAISSSLVFRHFKPSMQGKRKCCIDLCEKRITASRSMEGPESADGRFVQQLIERRRKNVSHHASLVDK